MMMNRRDFIATGAAAFGMAGIAGPAWSLETGEDGLYHQDFMVDSFLDMRDDWAEAADAGKTLLIMWEQKGCPYCREMHQKNLARPDIHDYVADNFHVIQLNLWGSREVTDIDGKAMEEKSFARRNRVNFTPTLQFFPTRSAATPGEDQMMLAEIARMPGYFKPFHFNQFLHFVHDGAWKDTNFQRFLQHRFDELKALGKEVDVWAD